MATAKGHGANRCPACGSRDIEGGFVEIDGTHACQHCRCAECGAGWTDVYDVVGYVPDDDADAVLRPYDGSWR